MIKYVDTKVTFSEVPDEITLCINISNCPCHCEGCHSAYLAGDIGEVLRYDNLASLIQKNRGITCVAFMGGDADPVAVNAYASIIKEQFPNLKTAWYSGRQELSEDIKLRNFDYIKLGPYIEKKGPLSSRTTNQRFYKVDALSPDGATFTLLDYTYKFFKNASTRINVNYT